MANSRRRRKPKKPLILMVEDEPALLELAKSNIEDAGFATLSAATVREALALLEDGTAVDVLFTDINLPDGAAPPLDGLELARRAVELHAGLPVLYTTGGSLTDGMRALFVEGSAFLPKPYRRDDLIQAIRAAVASASSRSNG